MAKRVLVAGGAGYLGRALAERLQARGDRVRVFDLSADDGVPCDEFLQGDVRDADAVKRACADVELVFDAVAQVPLAKDKAAFWSVNRDGTGNLLRAAADARARKFVYVSSSAVYGRPKSNPVTEATPPSPAEDYGAAKLAGETLCREAVKNGLDVAILRPRTILGGGRLGIFQVLFEWVRRGRNVPVLGDGSNRYQFVHVDDLASACLLAADRPGAADYNCGAERFGTMRETLQALCDHARTGSRVRSLPKGLVVPAMRAASALGLSPLGPYHALMYGESLYFDTAKARTELGWTPRYSNAEMITESYDWYLAHRLDARAASASPHRSGVKSGLLNLVGRFL